MNKLNSKKKVRRWECVTPLNAQQKKNASHLSRLENSKMEEAPKNAIVEYI